MSQEFRLITLENLEQEILAALERIGRPPKLKKIVPKEEVFITAEERQQILERLWDLIVFYKQPLVKKLFSARPRLELKFYTNGKNHLVLTKKGIYWIGADKKKWLPLNKGDLADELSKNSELMKEMLNDLKIILNWTQKMVEDVVRCQLAPTSKREYYIKDI